MGSVAQDIPLIKNSYAFMQKPQASFEGSEIEEDNLLENVSGKTYLI